MYIGAMPSFYDYNCGPVEQMELCVSSFNEDISYPLDSDMEINAFYQRQVIQAYPPFFNPFEQMESDFAKLFNGEGIKEVCNEGMPSIPEHLDVEMGQCQVIKFPIGNKRMLGTTNVVTCIAICARGYDKNNNVYLGVFHKCLESAEDVFREMFEKMARLGCQTETIKTFAIGGLKAANQDEVDNNTNDAEEELLRVGEVYGLTSARLHINSTENEAVNVCITEDCVVYNRHYL